MNKESIYQFIAKRDGMPSDKQLKEFQLQRYKRMLEITKDEKHKTYLRQQIYQLKKVTNEK
jgi:hypothetical protein